MSCTLRWNRQLPDLKISVASSAMLTLRTVSALLAEGTELDAVDAEMPEICLLIGLPALLFRAWIARDLLLMLS